MDITQTELENLQKLLDENPDTNPIQNQQIEDNDILFFSQYGYLEGTGDELTLPILQASNNPSWDDDSTCKEIDSSKNHQSQSRMSQMKYKVTNGVSTRVFKCGACGKEFAHQYTLMRHLPTHTNERKFHCDTCGKSFRQMSTLSQHRAIHSSERPYVCKVCNKNFNRVSTLISHSKTHTGIKPHRCHMCNKSFHQKGNLRNHIFTHTNERPYKCDVCEKGFNQMSNLMCHKMKAHQHQDEAISRHVCKVCGEEFLKRINLRQHEQLKHGIHENSHDNSPQDIANAIFVDPIKTDAMKMTMAAGQTPFALLRPLSGIPVLVRVLSAGEKQMLVPATADDLKKCGHISIKPKVVESDQQNTENESNIKGCVVQIKVPVVATVIQKTSGLNGTVDTNVINPVQGDGLNDLNGDTFIYTTLANDLIVSGEESKFIENSFQFDAFMSSVDEANNNLESNSAEFRFEIPQDARNVADLDIALDAEFNAPNSADHESTAEEVVS